MPFDLAKHETENEKKPRWFIVGIIFLALIKLWLIKGQTLIANGMFTLDDRLFLSLAENILNGHWLGPYNNTTLVKGCFYPIWIALVFLLNIPLLFAQHLLYILAVLVLIFAIKPFLNKPAILLIFFAVLLFNPATYTQYSLRVVREGIYPSLSLLVVATSIGALGRYRSHKIRFASWLIGLGIVLSAFWLTREEGVWIIPLVALILGWTAFKLWRSCISGWLSRCALCLTPFFILSIALLSVSTLNWIAYGSFTTVEVKNRNFLDAFGALNRVKPEKLISMVPVTKETRMRIYPLSPAFAEIEPYLEGDIGNVWAEISRHRYPELKGKEIAGGWFIWALRDAVSEAGYCTSAKKAMAYYRRLANEINSACDRGDLTSYPKRSTMMPVWKKELNRPLFNTIAKAAIYLATFKDMNADPAYSFGSESFLVIFRDLTRENLSPLSTSTIKLYGWTFGINDLNYSVTRADGSIADATIQWNESPDVYNFFLAKKKNFPNSQKARFEILATKAGDESIYLEARDYDGLLVKKVPLDGKTKWVQESNFNFCLDARVYSNEFLNQVSINRFRVMLLSRAGRFYQSVLPYLSALSIVAFLFGTIYTWFKENIFSDISIINIAILGALLFRISILSVIHITSFPGIIPVYLAPAYPLLIVFVLLAISGNGLSEIINFMRQRQKHISFHTEKQSAADSK